MRTYQHISTLAVILLATGPITAKPTSDEDIYLNKSKKLAPMVDVVQDEVIRFESDVTGDGKPEVFFTKASLRDGKHGYVWSIYERTSGGSIRSIGDITFSDAVFIPSKWKVDKKAQGFYTYFPSGAGRGSLAFFEVNSEGIARRELRKIQPNGEDEAEFEDMFGSRLKGETPKLKLIRTSLPKTHLSPKLPSDETLSRQQPETQALPYIWPSKVKPLPASKTHELKSSPTNGELLSLTPWPTVTVLIVVMIALMWLFLKRLLKD